MVHEDSQIVVCDIKGDVLVGLLREGTAVFIFDIDALAVLYEGSEPLTQAVDMFSHSQGELLPHVVLSVSVYIGKGASLR